MFYSSNLDPIVSVLALASLEYEELGLPSQAGAVLVVKTSAKMEFCG